MNRSSKIADGLLVVEAKKGNSKAQVLLVKKWHPKFCKQAFWYTKNKADCQDIAQDSWRVILEKLSTLRDPDRFGSWALSIVNRNAINWLRDQKKNQLKKTTYEHTFYTMDHPADSGSTSNRILLLKQAMNRLPVGQQQVVHLFYLEAFSIQEIATVLDLSEGTVKSRLFHARERLKNMLKTKNS